MKIFIATSNKHKVQEFSQMFENAGLNCLVHGVDEIDGFIPPVEDGSTFAENSFIKARALKKFVSDAFVMADDSGIVVDALNGAPGIYSARYAGVDGANADLSNNEKLLKELENVPDCERSARFVCAIALITPSEDEFVFEGKIEGFINHGAVGCGGFGYDPLFYVPEFNKTTAELSAEEKNKVSHRGQAFKKMVEFLKKQKV
ncbi:MAG: XTP/dITP diphosphatase [Verrucomicrobiaceae bacterium]|nr:XTP/dITP diphosphatase [Verrucomicrobiaceae bacterium]